VQLLERSCIELIEVFVLMSNSFGVNFGVLSGEEEDSDDLVLVSIELLTNIVSIFYNASFLNSSSISMIICKQVSELCFHLLDKVGEGSARSFTSSSLLDDNTDLVMNNPTAILWVDCFCEALYFHFKKIIHKKKLRFILSHVFIAAHVADLADSAMRCNGKSPNNEAPISIKLVDLDTNKLKVFAAIKDRHLLEDHQKDEVQLYNIMKSVCLFATSQVFTYIELFSAALSLSILVYMYINNP
jgi:hypothetical protein